MGCFGSNSHLHAEHVKNGQTQTLEAAGAYTACPVTCPTLESGMGSHAKTKPSHRPSPVNYAVRVLSVLRKGPRGEPALRLLNLHHVV